MKIILIIAAICASTFTMVAAQWTIHASRSNFTRFEVTTGYFGLGHPEVWHECAWDAKHSRQSGYYEIQWNGGNQLWGTPSGYQDAITFETSDDPEQADLTISVWISGPAPKYSNKVFSYWYPSLGDWGPFVNGPGEYWIDRSPDGSLRVSTSLPTGFQGPVAKYSTK